MSAIRRHTILRLYHSQLRKERANEKSVLAERGKSEPRKQGWVSWALGYSAPTASENEETGSDALTDKQSQELYAAIDYDESDEVIGGLVLSRDIMKDPNIRSASY